MTKFIHTSIVLFLLSSTAYSQAAFRTGELSLDASYIPFDKEHSESMLVFQVSTNLSKRFDAVLSINSFTVYKQAGSKLGSNYLLGLGTNFSVYSNYWLSVKLTGMVNRSNYLHLNDSPFVQRRNNFNFALTPVGIYRLPVRNRCVSIRAGVLLSTPFVREVFRYSSIYERITGHPFLGLGFRLGTMDE